MQDLKLKRSALPLDGIKTIFYVFLAIVLLGMGLYVNNIVKAVRTATSVQMPSAITHVSQADLEAQYGLHVNLVAVTAVGGLVDVRFKIVDGEKARSLLQQPKNFPTLQVAESPVVLSAPEEGRPAEIQFENGANLFLIYPNTGGIVKSGTQVTITFGALQVEPVLAK